MHESINVNREILTALKNVGFFGDQLACPECGKDDGIRIVAEAHVRLRVNPNNGTPIVEWDMPTNRDELYWDDSSPVSCQCGWVGAFCDTDIPTSTQFDMDKHLGITND